MKLVFVSFSILYFLSLLSLESYAQKNRLMVKVQLRNDNSEYTGRVKSVSDSSIVIQLSDAVSQDHYFRDISIITVEKKASVGLKITGLIIGIPVGMVVGFGLGILASEECESCDESDDSLYIVGGTLLGAGVGGYLGYAELFTSSKTFKVNGNHRTFLNARKFIIRKKGVSSM